MLEPLGVSPSAEAIYLAMLQQPGADIKELAASLELSTRQVDAALDELGRLCLLRPSWQDPSALRPVAPAVALEALLAAQQAELTRRQQEIAESRLAVEALVAAFPGPGTPGNALVAEFVGLDEVRDGLERLVTQTQYELLTFAPDGAQTAVPIRASAALNRELLDRGVTMRTLLLTSTRNDPPIAAYAQELTELGGQLRTVPVLPTPMLVVDRTWAVLPRDPERAAAGAVVLRSPGTVTALRALFDYVWRTGTVWGSRQQADDEGIAEQERALLQLLSEGCTDEQAGRKLGVSTRTVRRIAADLMTRLNARSRFQAGALAVARKWLESDFIDAPPVSRPATASSGFAQSMR